MALHKLEAVIFDWYGVFYVDSHKSLEEHFPQEKDNLNNIRLQADYGYIDRQSQIQQIAKLLNRSIGDVTAIIEEEHSINQALLEFVSQYVKPRYKIGLISNVGRGWMENFFTKYKLHDFFEVVILSGDEGIAKPHPRIFELMTERLGVTPEECIMIDDLPENIAGADAAGMKGIVYSNLRDMKIELQEMLDAGTT